MSEQSYSQIVAEFPYVQDVKLFHDKFGLATPPEFIRLDDSLHSFRSNFFREELEEYETAVREKDLATTLDSLIDLVYIIAGTALVHGIKPEEFYGAVIVTESFFHSDAILASDIADEPATLSLPDMQVVSAFVEIMENHIISFDSLHESEDETLAFRHECVKYILSAMFCSCIVAAAYSGCTMEAWDELWADVQRANMSKERALKASDSKRGSTYDVIKPAGWIPPQTEAIIAKHQASA